VATFKQILKENVLSLPALGTVNFHPSLLPLYRGPCPSHAALLQNEKVTGITVHYVTEQVDQGNILLQRSLDIAEDDNDGRLRQKLAILAGEMIPDVIGMFADFTKPEGGAQKTDSSSYAPRPKAEDGHLELARDVDEVWRRVRAFNPLPGTSIQVGDRRIAVDRTEFFDTTSSAGVLEGEHAVELIINSRGIRLFKRMN
jgi:methionyl-tRNA formyltransferase